MEEIFKNLRTCGGQSLPSESDLKARIATKVFSFDDLSEGLDLASMSVGADGDPLLLFDNVGFRRGGAAAHAHYQQMLGDSSVRRKIIRFLNGKIMEMQVKVSPGRTAVIHALGADKYLLAYSGVTADGMNAWIMNADGSVENKFPIGMAFTELQVTSNGNMWLGYDDYGVFSGDIFSRNVYSCFDRSGRLLFPAPNSHCDFSNWSGGLNVASDDCVWLFPSGGELMRFQNFEKVHSFNLLPLLESNIIGPGAFSICENRACWAPMLDFDFFSLVNLDDCSSEFFRVISADGEILDHHNYVSRGSKMFFVASKSVYSIDVRDMSFNT
ncbi:MAG: hypothetical protein KGS72_17700 [Cyanobacteria bacterium REEB67]|nr:hypothetical protein [Cyanobacteria bacterium REEB67]